MGKGLNYAQKRQIARDTELKIGVLTGFQKACDFWGISLYEEGFGEVRLERLARRVMQLDDELGDAWTKSEEADYMQEQVDRILKKHTEKTFHRLQNGIHTLQNSIINPEELGNERN